MTWTHYHTKTRTLYEPTQCPWCCGEALMPNSVKLAQPKVPGHLIVNAGELPPELGYYDEVLGCETCRAGEGGVR